MAVKISLDFACKTFDSFEKFQNGNKQNSRPLNDLSGEFSNLTKSWQIYPKASNDDSRDISVPDGSMTFCINPVIDSGQRL